MKKIHYNSTYKLIKYCIDKEVDVNAGDRTGDTALHYVIRNCISIDPSISVAGLLLESGARVDASNNAGQTALHVAVELSNFALCEYLVSVGADVECTTKQFKSMLQLSIEKCNLQITEFLIKKGAHIDNILSDEGSLLHIAIKSSEPGKLRLDLVKLLLESGANINSCNAYQSSPLHLVLHDKDEECAKLLISQGSSIDCRNNEDNTPLRIAVKENLEKSVGLLLSKGANPNDINLEREYNSEFKRSMMYHAVWTRNLSIIRLLFKFGDVKKEDRDYGLRVSAAYHDITMVKYFLSKGADIDSRTGGGSTLVDGTMFSRKDEPENMTQLLIDHGADVIKEAPLVHFRGGWSYRVALCLIRHLALLTIKGVDIGVSNLSTIEKRSYQKSYYDDCHKELLLMKSAAIPDSTLTLYDLLTKNSNEMVQYVQNESIVATIKSDEVLSSYPKYSWNLRYKLLRGQEKLNLIDKGRRFFNGIIPSGVPVEILSLICELLSDEDLSNLGKVRFASQKTAQFSMTLRTGRKKKYFLPDKQF